jgi:hypothetical protein
MGVDEGVLRTSSGRALAPTSAFRGEPPETPPPAESGRLVRRPDD